MLIDDDQRLGVDERGYDFVDGFGDQALDLDSCPNLS